MHTNFSYVIINDCLLIESASTAADTDDADDVG